jgi:putative ABC transport system permease protein
VRRYFKDRNPIGARIGRGSQPDTIADIEVIGVIKDFSRSTLRDERPGLVFLPFWDRQSASGTFYVKTHGAPESTFTAIRETVTQVAPALPAIELTTFATQIDRSLRPERMLAALSSGFGIVALLLSAVGLYGVMAFVVTQRRQEIGVRLALGATRADAVWLVVRDALIMTVLGIATAVPLAWVLRRLIEAQLFGVRAFDGPTIAIASTILALVALAGALIPAWRAASVSPTEALRLE